ncbi:MAG TPA: aspartate-semialdehyde dehydrogenase, partial [Gemmatimonadaceae bacterium]|nr:aspartate-semialdehyde dehydrogenase [Gemmatimonadaceae bacterium]
FVALLAAHPWFELAAVAASGRSAGRRFADAARWAVGDLPPGARERVAEMIVRRCDPEEVDAPIVFSALDSGVAREVEERFARAGRTVLTNARDHRMDDDVPLVIPEVNPDHLALLECQRARRGWSGAIVANGNCAAIVVALALAPLHRAFGVRRLFVTTLQALSGAGHPGVPSLDILGNIIPFIGGGEEEKIEREPPKMLGRLEGGAVLPAGMAISAQVNRVPVEHGHTACMSVALEKRASTEEAVEALRSWRGEIAELGLPSAPERPLAVSADEARPQPRRDADAGRGMTVTVGRVRRDPILDLRLVATGHNIVRGAAGASVLNAELLVARGMVGGLSCTA